MTSFSALYFPDTLPPPAAVAGLAPLLAPLRSHRCWPDDRPPSPWSELAAAGQLEFLASFDPGPDSRRLQALLRELAGRKGEDALLFAQSLAAEFSAQREETTPELKGPLLGLAEDASAARERENIWQALLLLKLAENLERDEQEAEEKLQAIETRRAAMFRQLNGDETAAEAGHQNGEPSVPPRSWRNPGRQLRAWSRLFLRTPERPQMLVSADAEAWSLLLDRAENRDPSPKPLATLQLPRTPELTAKPEDDTPSTGKPWREARQTLLAALEQAAADGNGAAATTAADTWNRQVAGHEANHPPGRHTLEIVLLPQTPLSRLILDYNRFSSPAESEKKGHEEKPHGLIALYR